MPTVRASVLLIGHPKPETIEFGADFAANLDDAKRAMAAYRYPVIALASDGAGAKADGHPEEDPLELLEFANVASPHSQRVIIQNDASAESLRKIINKGSVFRILSAYDDPRFALTIEEALEEYRLLQQNVKLLQLVNEQNDRLKKLTGELEERVEARRKSLDEAKEKLLVTNHRVEALHRALVAIHRAGSIAEMERLINEAVSGALGLSFTRVLFNSQARITSPGLDSSLVVVHSAPLMRGKDLLGQIYFAREATRPFTRDENGFLGQIADSVALAIDRLTKLEQSESLKHQWEATFDAIVDPVSVITHEYTLVRINRSFARRSGAEPEKVIGRKCYEALFGRTSPCEGCEIQRPQVKPIEGIKFRLKPNRTVGGETTEPEFSSVIYDVFSQEIQFIPEGRALYVNMYHDVSAQLRLERQILESAKMAELGTIGSSIAHELNNPLGGMLSFLQLIKMDLKGDEPCADDIDSMEEGARRCRDIVQNLLGFTRKSATDTVELIDVGEVLEQALKITELQTRSMGIKVTRYFPDQTAMVRGQFNTLAQAFRNFLQNAHEAIAERRRRNDSEKNEGEIKIVLRRENQIVSVQIIDDGTGFDEQIADQIYDPLYTTKNPDHNPGLGLTLAQQIIRDHGGELEIHSTQGTGTWAKISLPSAN